MKKLLKQLAFALLLINLILTISTTIVYAQDDATRGGTVGGEDPEPRSRTEDVAETDGFFGPLSTVKEVGENTQLEGFETGQHPDAPPDFLQEGVGTATSPIYFAIDLFRYAMSGVALIVIVIQAIKLVSTANDEEAGKAKTTLLVGIIGLLIIQLADVIVKQMFFGEQGEAFEDPVSAEIFAESSVEQLRGIIGFVQVFVGAAAVLVIVLRGFMLITSGGDEEGMTKAKKHLLYAIVGLFVVILSEVVVRGVIFPEGGQELPDAERGAFIIISITNYLAGFVAILAFVTLFYGGYKYVVSAGNEEETENVKKIFIGATIALILALGAFALVNTLLKFEQPEETEQDSQPEIIEPAEEN